MSLLRQAPLFLLMGGIQLLLDSAVTIGLSSVGLAFFIPSLKAMEAAMRNAFSFESTSW